MIQMKKMKAHGVVRRKTKQELVDHITMAHNSIQTFGGSANKQYSCYTNKDSFILFNLEKRRRKTKVLPKGIRRIVREAHWVGFVYVVPKALADASKKFEAKQHKRHFTLNVQF